jgi:hypothetical protein
MLIKLEAVHWYNKDRKREMNIEKLYNVNSLPLDDEFFDLIEKEYGDRPSYIDWKLVTKGSSRDPKWV